jgi:hypothetical protein
MGEDAGGEEKTDTEAMVAYLETMEEDMQRWEKILMPLGTKCIVLTKLFVALKFQ